LLASGVSRYRASAYTEVEQQVGSQAQRTTHTVRFQLTASLEPSGRRLRATFTVDSLATVGGPDAAAPDANLLPPARFAADLELDGRLSDLHSEDPAHPRIEPLADQISQLYPRIPERGLRPGDTWSDTTQTTTTGKGLPLHFVVISHHEVPVPTGGSSDTLVIRTVSSYRYSGSGTQSGQVYTVQGEGRRHAVRRLTMGGRLVDLRAADTSSFSIAIPALETSLPGRQIRADTVVLIP